MAVAQGVEDELQLASGSCDTADVTAAAVGDALRSTQTALFCDSMAAMSIRLVPGRCECVGAFWAYTTAIRSC